MKCQLHTPSDHRKWSLTMGYLDSRASAGVTSAYSKPRQKDSYYVDEDNRSHSRKREREKERERLRGRKSEREIKKRIERDWERDWESKREKVRQKENP